MTVLFWKKQIGLSNSSPLIPLLLDLLDPSKDISLTFG